MKDWLKENVLGVSIIMMLFVAMGILAYTLGQALIAVSS